MRIVTHIKIFLTLIISIIVVNAFIGMQQINLINESFKKVVNENFLLILDINKIMKFQDQRMLILERAINISEELNFDRLQRGRKEYILDYAKDLNNSHKVITQQMRGRVDKMILFFQEYREKDKEYFNKNFKKSWQFLENINKNCEIYDDLVNRIIDNISLNKFELTFVDIEMIEKRKSHLEKSLKHLYEQVDYLSKESIILVERNKNLANETFRISFIVSLIFSLLIFLFIIRRVSRPLKKIAISARRIGAGNFDVKVETTNKDEIADVAYAFNTMTDDLGEKDSRLRKQSAMLKKNLQISKVQKQDLEKINRELDHFVHTVSHDIVSPLMGIAWYSEYLNKNTKERLNEKEKRCIESISNTTQRLAKMTKDLLSLTRITRIQNPYEEVDVCKLIQSILERMEFQIEQTQADIILPKNSCTIVCDLIKLKEVFYNLITNGIKFCAKGRTPIIVIDYGEVNGKHQFSVKDNGIGLAKEFHKDVFDIFKRFHSDKKYEGTGMGLAIVREIIHDHAGDIWITSNESGGTIFTFTISKQLINRERLI